METVPEQKVGFLTGLGQRVQRFFKILWFLAQYLLNRSLDALARDVIIIQREADLFLGATLFLVGFLGFDSARYCDGNVNDHISCTRPATYYYFDWLDVTLIVLGVFLILVWYFKHKERIARPSTKKN